MSTKRERELWRKAFNKVVNHYLELKSLSGSLSCAGLYQSIGRQGAGKTAFNSSVVRPLPSDFICEVERIATKTLSADDTMLYKDQYLTQAFLHKEEWKSNKYRIQELLGEQYIKCKLYPLGQYFKAKDTR